MYYQKHKFIFRHKIIITYITYSINMSYCCHHDYLVVLYLKLSGMFAIDNIKLINNESHHFIAERRLPLEQGRLKFTFLLGQVLSV